HAYRDRRRRPHPGARRRASPRLAGRVGARVRLLRIPRRALGGEGRQGALQPGVPSRLDRRPRCGSRVQRAPRRTAVRVDGLEGPVGHPRGGRPPLHGVGFELHDDGAAGGAGGVRHRRRGVRQVLLHRERDVMASTTVRRMPGLTIEEHTLTVPLVWGDPADARTIDVFAAVVSREGGETLPYLLFLQGGPGHEAPRAFGSPSSPAWLEAALTEHRVVLLDQRGTGRSTAVSDRDLERGTDA